MGRRWALAAGLALTAGLLARPAAAREPQSMVELAITLRQGADMASVEAALAQAGLVIEHRLAAVGSITGRAAPQAIPRLRAVAGVEEVEEIAPVRIAPPDSPVQ